MVVRAAFNPSLDRGIDVWRDYISRYCLGLAFYDAMRGLGPFVPDSGSLRPLRSRWPEQASADFLTLGLSFLFGRGATRAAIRSWRAGHAIGTGGAKYSNCVCVC